MFGPAGDSSFTKSVRDLISAVQGSDRQDSLYQQASDYFSVCQEQQQKVQELRFKIKQLEEQEADLSSDTDSDLAARINRLARLLKDQLSSQEKQRRNRLAQVILVCEKLLLLCDAVDEQQSLNNSSKILSTILLLSPGEGKKLEQLHKRYKHLYKAVLSVRLLDRLLQDGNITNKHILKYYEPETRFAVSRGKFTAFQTEVVIPIIMAAIFQDVGMYHPDAVKLLRGKKGSLDEFRVLEPQDRLALLRLSHEQSLSYLSHGLGCEQYVGNSQEEKSLFDQQQKDKLSFARILVNDSVAPRQGLGNLLKVPQIYTSVVLSTKPNYDIRELPKAAILLTKVATQGAISITAANSLIEIVGYFPQGFGIAYLPDDERSLIQERYEYAIVNSLYPVDPRVPHCRIVTRNLTYVSYGNNLLVSEKNNLFFPATQKKMQKVDEQRLREIIVKLYHDFEQRGANDLIPKCWQPYDYFSFKKNQNLWNKKETIEG
jgi:hypothetical protein